MRDLLVLHTLRCTGAVGLDALAEAAGLPVPDVESDLIDLAVAGLVTRARGDFGGWRVTDAGRAADAERTAAALDAAGARTAVARAYDDFLALNPELLDICGAWQAWTIDGALTLNDHTDAGYDARVLARLAALHRRADVVCADLSAGLARFDRYRVRLGRALDRVHAGELAYVTESTASYHSVWFQLHEDLLVTLGIPRAH